MQLFASPPEKPSEQLHKKEEAMGEARAILLQMEQLAREIEERAAKIDQLKGRLAEVQKRLK